MGIYLPSWFLAVFFCVSYLIFACGKFFYPQGILIQNNYRPKNMQRGCFVYFLICRKHPVFPLGGSLGIYCPILLLSRLILWWAPWVATAQSNKFSNLVCERHFAPRRSGDLLDWGGATGPAPSRHFPCEAVRAIAGYRALGAKHRLRQSGPCLTSACLSPSGAKGYQWSSESAPTAAREGIPHAAHLRPAQQYPDRHPGDQGR